jgi:ABC-type spermidine/putrescine transport system permease subunit I
MEVVRRYQTWMLEQVPFLLSLPAFLWQMYFLLIPLLFIARYSVVTSSGEWTIQNYAELFQSSYLHIILNSCLFACITAALCLLIAYPVAYYLAMRAGRWKTVLLVFLILPSWTSFIIQIYSWFYLLQKKGLFSNFLYAMGWTSEPLSFLNNYSASVLGMVYCYLPFMILPLYTVLEKMDKRLLEAAADLGANRWKAFTSVVFPLSQSGIQVGLALVMVPAFGEFAIPDLMGGSKNVSVGRVIAEKFLFFRDWHSGASVVMLSFFIPVAIVALFYLIRQLYTVLTRRGV